MSDEKRTAFRATVHGRVQGVGFRYTARDRAKRLGVTGWVRNRRDGAVEIAAEGGPEQLAQFEAWLRNGPPGARVTAVDVRNQRRSHGYPAFTIEF